MVGLDGSFRTIRHNHCQKVVANFDKTPRCGTCALHRKTLQKALSRIGTEKSVNPDSRCNFRYLSREELEMRLFNTQTERREYKRKMTDMERALREAIDKESVFVTKEMEELVTNTLLNTPPDESIFKPGSPQHLLWAQQQEQAKKKDKRGMRWHPLMIRWSLAIRHTSPAAYRQLRNSGFLCLPCESTLSKFLNFTSPTSGFNVDIIKNLVSEANLSKEPEYKRNVSLVYDEMKISSKLVYSKSTGVLRGFLEGGDINDEMENFHRRIEGGDVQRPLASYVNMFMVRGLFSSLAYAFGYFAGEGFNSGQLYPIVWSATEVLESVGFVVRCFVSDGASPNRKFYRIHSQNGQFTFKTANMHAEGRDVYFISDAPHLIKTTRNNFENSHSHNNTRNLHVRYCN